MAFNAVMRLAGVLIIASCVVAATAAEPKPAWQWTDEERTRALLDPVKREERVEAGMARRRHFERLRGESPDPFEKRPWDVLDGKRDPELFFPTELFEWLVSKVISFPDRGARLYVRSPDDLFGSDAEEWRQFVELAQDLVEVLQAERQLVEQSTPSTPPPAHMRADIRRLKCAASRRGLTAARETFGAERFDRFLYERVARSGSRSVYSEETTMNILAARQRPNCE